MSAEAFESQLLDTLPITGSSTARVVFLDEVENGKLWVN